MHRLTQPCPDTTRPIEFGPFAAVNRRKRRLGKLETFDFLGLAHIWTTKRSNSRFTVLRLTMARRPTAKRAEIEAQLKRRMRNPVPEVGQWLRSVVEGHFHYYGVPMNGPAPTAFRFHTVRLWHRALSRCSQGGWQGLSAR
jgi:RNA-directed DNA polymerase